MSEHPKDVNRFDWRSVMKAKDTATVSKDQAEQERDAYFKVFAEPERKDTDGFVFGEHVCLKCGKPQLGMLGNFSWGLVHGEGHCRNCRWPARLYHFLKVGGMDIGRVDLLLQYHPDGVTQKEAAE